MQDLHLFTEAFLGNDEDEMLAQLHIALDAGMDPVEIVSTLSAVLEGIGEQFSLGELYLPDMVVAGDQMEQCMDILRPAIVAQAGSMPTAGKVVIGSVQGDIHDIGKNMVKTMLIVSGFEVVDLGADVSAEQFYASALAEKPQIVALSSCMTTTVPSMVATIDLFKSKGLDQKCKIVVGGGSMNPQLAAQFGGCIYGGKDAFEASHILKALV